VTLPADNTEDLTNDCGLVMIVVGGDEGCSQGYWKNHLASWGPTGYDPQDKLGDIFTIPAPFSRLAAATLRDAFGFSGGPQTVDKAALLMKQAAAALLNASHPGVDYEIATAQNVIDSVNVALASLDKGQILDLKDDLDWFNNAGCPLGGPGGGGNGGGPPHDHRGGGDAHVVDGDNQTEPENLDDRDGEDDNPGRGRSGRDKEKDDKDSDEPDPSVADGADESEKKVIDAEADALPITGCGESVAVPMAFLGITWCVVVASRRSRSRK
jgi:hypothetical protein